MMRSKVTFVFLLLGLLFVVPSLSQTADVKAETQALISSLKDDTWRGVERLGESPTQWDFNLSQPMVKILQTGKPAQQVLIQNLDASPLRGQIIFLLGGVGDETAIQPIIDAMIPSSKISGEPQAKIINGAANIALTNITVADVIFHRGGGVVVERCPGNPKECWQNWWDKNRSTFRVDKITQSRCYSNYPGYGIYKGLK